VGTKRDALSTICNGGSELEALVKQLQRIAQLENRIVAAAPPAQQRHVMPLLMLVQMIARFTNPLMRIQTHSRSLHEERDLCHPE
jgi:hypothetical protein